jgi:hypothetical protein
VNETIPLVINALKVLGELYIRGAETHLAFAAPKEQAAAVPTTKELQEVLHVAALLKGKESA